MTIYIYGNKGFKGEVDKAFKRANMKYKLSDNDNIFELKTLNSLKNAIKENPNDVFIIDDEKIIKSDSFEDLLNPFKPRDRIEDAFLQEYCIDDIEVDEFDDIAKYVIKELKKEHKNLELERELQKSKNKTKKETQNSDLFNGNSENERSLEEIRNIFAFLNDDVKHDSENENSFEEKNKTKEPSLEKIAEVIGFSLEENEIPNEPQERSEKTNEPLQREVNKSDLKENDSEIGWLWSNIKADRVALQDNIPKEKENKNNITSENIYVSNSAQLENEDFGLVIENIENENFGLVVEEIKSSVENVENEDFDLEVNKASENMDNTESTNFDLVVEKLNSNTANVEKIEKNENKESADFDLVIEETSDNIENTSSVLVTEEISNSSENAENADPDLIVVEVENKEKEGVVDVENEFSELDNLNENDLLKALEGDDGAEISENIEEVMQEKKEVKLVSNSLEEISSLISQLLKDKTLEITVRVKD